MSFIPINKPGEYYSLSLSGLPDDDYYENYSMTIRVGELFQRSIGTKQPTYEHFEIECDQPFIGIINAIKATGQTIQPKRGPIVNWSADTLEVLGLYDANYNCIAGDILAKLLPRFYKLYYSLPTQDCMVLYIIKNDVPTRVIVVLRAEEVDTSIFSTVKGTLSLEYRKGGESTVVSIKLPRPLPSSQPTFNPIVLSALMASGSNMDRELITPFLTSSRFTPTEIVLNNITEAADFILGDYPRDDERQTGLCWYDIYNLTKYLVYYIENLDEHHIKTIEASAQAIVEMFHEYRDVSLANMGLSLTAGPARPVRPLYLALASLLKLQIKIKYVTIGIRGEDLASFGDWPLPFPYFKLRDTELVYQLITLMEGTAVSKSNLKPKGLTTSFPKLGTIHFIRIEDVTRVGRELPDNVMILPASFSKWLPYGIPTSFTDKELMDLYIKSSNPYNLADAPNEKLDNFQEDLVKELTGESPDSIRRSTILIEFLIRNKYKEIVTKATARGAYAKLVKLYKGGQL